ncbi:MAG: hypothetical protein M1132_03520 [Chloroflexi bacterium]|nr:hypothetical protein [Chloroflexota bacterium]
MKTPAHESSSFFHHIGQVASALVWWALSSLVAIALVETNGLAGLAAAVVGGLVLGFFLFK